MAIQMANAPVAKFLLASTISREMTVKGKRLKTGIQSSYDGGKDQPE